MPVLVTSNFDDDSIKNKRASMETAVSHYKSMEKFLDAQEQAGLILTAVGQPFILWKWLCRTYMHYKPYDDKSAQMSCVYLVFGSFLGVLIIIFSVFY